MRIQAYLRSLLATAFLGLTVFAAVAFTALLRTEINGPVYRTIALGNDLVADFVPPSESLLGAALTCSMMIETSDPVELQRDLTQFQDARKTFEEKHAVYMRRVPEGALKNMMRGTAFVTAEQYFEMAAREFIPLVMGGAREQAQEILTSRMNPLYRQHAAAVDRIVAAAAEEAHDGEAAAATAVRFYTEAMAGVGLLILVAGGALALIIARGISRQADELIHSEKSRREQAKLLHSVLASMTEGVMVADGEGKIQVCNAPMARLLGHTPAMYQPNQWYENLVCYSPGGEALPTKQWPLARALRGEESEIEMLVRSTLRPDDLWLEVAARPLKDDSAERMGAVAVFRDVTQRKIDTLELSRKEAAKAEVLAALELERANLERRVEQRTAELSAAKEAAEDSDRLKSAFLATMSHELRTPLNSIIGFTGIALQELAGPLNQEQKKQLGMVLNSARHLLALINDVLDLTKIEAGHLEVRAEAFDARQSVAKVVQSVLPQADKKGLRLFAEIAPEVGTIFADRRRMEQILLNLLSNGIKFTEQGEIQVCCLLKDGWLETSVRDSGIGIHPGDLVHLFKPFRQLDSGLARKHEGTGLGLSICNKLVGMMGGTISVKSLPGLGSTFMYRLPQSEGTSRERHDSGN